VVRALEKCIKFIWFQNTGCIVLVNAGVNSWAGMKHYRPNSCCLQMLCQPFIPSFDNCFDRWQSLQFCNCSGGVSSILWTATVAGAAGAVFRYTLCTLLEFCRTVMYGTWSNVWLCSSLLCFRCCWCEQSLDLVEMSYSQPTLTFDKAFKGKYAALAEKIDTSHGLWNQLLDRDVLTSQQISTCQVLAYLLDSSPTNQCMVGCMQGTNGMTYNTMNGRSYTIHLLWLI